MAAVNPGTRRTAFVILSTQRSGSNYLEDRLAVHPEVTMHPHEVFRKTLASGGYEEFRRESPRRFVASRIAPAVTKGLYLQELLDPSGARIVGFRLMYDQVRRSPSLGPQLLARGWPIVHLIRRNMLATLVSTLTAQRTGQFITRTSGDASPRVTVPVDGLIHRLDRRRTRIDRYRRILPSRRTIEVVYEDHVDTPVEQDRRILDFLGVDPDVTLRTELRRMSRGRTADRIENLDEVTECLAGTAYADMLEY